MLHICSVKIDVHNGEVIGLENNGIWYMIMGSVVDVCCHLFMHYEFVSVISLMLHLAFHLLYYNLI